MSKLSEKYLAGFLDADGCIRLWHADHSKKPNIYLQWVQKTSNDEVLHLIERDYGASVYVKTVNGVEYSTAQIAGKQAQMLLSRISKHLVVKRHYANIALDCLGDSISDHKEFSIWMKEQRRIKSLPLPNFPPRKWLAGFFDGDGCLAVQQINLGGSASIIAHVSTSEYDTESIELLQKCFGGSIHGMKGRTCKQWKVSLVPSKAKEFLGYFAKYSIIKKDQIDFVLHCAEMGHFRDGNRIKAILSELKTREHRLSETERQELFASVKDLPKPEQKPRRYATVGLAA